MPSGEKSGGEEDRLDVLQEQEFCLEKDEIFGLALEKIILLYVFTYNNTKDIDTRTFVRFLSSID